MKLKFKRKLCTILLFVLALAISLTGCSKTAGNDKNITEPGHSNTEPSQAPEITDVPSLENGGNSWEDSSPTLDEQDDTVNQGESEPEPENIIPLSKAYSDVPPLDDTITPISYDIFNEPSKIAETIITDENGKGLLRFNAKDPSVATAGISVILHELVGEMMYIKIHGTHGTDASSYQLSLLVDMEGNVVWSSTDDIMGAFPVGDGYFIINTEVSGFDENYVIHDIYDRSGNHLFQYDDRDGYTLEYIGDGMFCPLTTGDSHTAMPSADLVAATTGQWVHYDDISDDDMSRLARSLNNVHFYNGKLMMPTENGLLILDNQGGSSILPYPEGFPSIASYSDKYWNTTESMMVVNVNGNYEKGYGIYNIKTGSFYQPNVDYTDKIYSFVGSGNYVIARMKGADGADYYALFDNELNELIPPTKGSFSSNFVAVVDDRLYIYRSYDISVYDVNGNLKYAFKDKGYDETSSLSKSSVINGNIFLKLENGPEVLVDSDGNIKFEEIDATDAIDLTDMLVSLYKGGSQ